MASFYCCVNVIPSLFFAITTGISSYYLVKFRKEGIMPYESKSANPHHASGETQKDNAWSTEIEQADSDDEDRHTERGGNQEEDEYALLHSTDTDEGRHPGRPLSWGDDRFGSDPVRPTYAAYDDTTSALSPGGYEEYRGAAAVSVEAHGPAAPYGSGGQGYSFSGGNR
jgi:hypothetical protein